MNSIQIFFFTFLMIVNVLCSTEKDLNEDYSSEDVAQKVYRLQAEGAEYLQKVMKQLQNDRMQAQTLEIADPGTLFHTQRVYEGHEKDMYAVTSMYNISGPTPVPDIEAEIVANSPPPISLSKEELLALYQAAVVKATELQDEKFGQETLQTLPETDDQSVKPTLQGQMGNSVSGYYYYYYPIKSFLKPSQTPKEVLISSTTPPQQIHATITMMDSPNKKAVEPLFMAISGFIGMALMFFFSILFVPKFSKLRSKNAQFKDEPDEMATFAQITLEAMAGKDCSERLACEIARIFRGLKSNNKPLRVLEIILPPNLAYQISQIRKAAGKKAKCGYVPCKMKKPKPPPQKHTIKLSKKKETTHDLWMKHFEKEKQPHKKQPFWNKKTPSKKVLKP